MKEDSPTKHFFTPHALARQVPGTRIIYITPLIIPLINEEERQTLAWISGQLGEKSWQDAIIIFVHERRKKRAWNLAAMQKRRSDMLRLAIAAHVGWDIASSIATIIIDAPENPLTDSQRWLQQHSPFTSTYHLIQTGSRKITPLTVVPTSPSCRQPAQAISPYPPRYAAIFIYFYLACTPIGTLGMFIAGISGYFIALLLTLVSGILFMLFRALR